MKKIIEWFGWQLYELAAWYVSRVEGANTLRPCLICGVPISRAALGSKICSGCRYPV